MVVYPPLPADLLTASKIRRNSLLFLGHLRQPYKTNSGPPSSPLYGRPGLTALEV
jgi:hypothetical protein